MTIAAWFDLKHRVQALEDSGLSVVSDYKGDGLPKWLTPALGDCDVFVLNVKGVPTDSILCILRLSKIEELVEVAQNG